MLRQHRFLALAGVTLTACASPVSPVGKECNDRRPCPTGYACAERSPGEARVCMAATCADDDGCPAGWICDAAACARLCNIDTDCPRPGQVCRPGGVCSGCAVDSDCNSGDYCGDDALCRLGLAMGEAGCTRDAMCIGGYCDLSPLGPETGRCCDGGECCDSDTDDCGGGSFCRSSAAQCVDGAAGSGCDDHGDCDGPSLICFSDRRCATTLADGAERCAADSDCQSGHCDTSAVGPETGRCCAAGECCDDDADCAAGMRCVTRVDGAAAFSCRTGEVGALCDDDADCASGSFCRESTDSCGDGSVGSGCDDHGDCDGPALLCLATGSCASPLETGATGCRADSECAGGYCDLSSVGAEQSRCCSGGECCDEDADCVAGWHCVQFVDGAATYGCRAGDVNAPCDEDADCDVGNWCRESTDSCVNGSAGSKCDDDLDCDAALLCRLSTASCVGGSYLSGCDDNGDCHLPYFCLATACHRRLLHAGSTTSGALREDGLIKCWGDNAYGQLGLGDLAARGDGAGEMGASLPTVNLGAGRVVTQLALGAYHSCALLNDGAIKCWGANYAGQLGLGDTANRGDDAGEMGDTLPTVILGGPSIAVTTGGSHTCAILASGAVKCWGANGNGRLGLGDTVNRGDAAGEMGTSLPAVSLGAGSTAVAIDASEDHTCVILAGGAVKCWGANTYGKLGLGDTLNRGDSLLGMGDALPAVNLGSNRTAVQIAVGYRFSCAVLDDGSVKCWGFNGNGELGLGDTLNRGDGANEMGDALPVVALGSGRSAIAIGSGDYSSCALLDDLSVKCWGGSSWGSLGNGSVNNLGDASGEMGDALPVVALGAGRTTRQLAVGGQHACGVLDTGGVKCWGLNGQGQLGLGNTLNRGDDPGEMGDSLPAVSIGW